MFQIVRRYKMSGQDKLSSKTDIKTKSNWLPIAAGLFICVLTLALWKTVDIQEKNDLHDKVHAQTEYIRTLIEDDIENRFPGFQRMANLWANQNGISKDVFTKNATSYMNNFPGFQGINWADKEGFVRWVVPLQGNEQVQDLNIALDKNRYPALEKARRTQSPTVTRPLALIKGARGFLAYFPVYSYGELDGYIIGVIRIQDWLDYVLSAKSNYFSLKDYRIQVLFDEDVIYKQDGWDSLKKYDYHIHPTVPLMDHNLYIHVRPTDAYIKENISFLPNAILIFGFLFSILTSLIVYLYQKADWEKQRLTVSNQALENEVKERQKIEQELQDALMHIDLAVKSAKMGIWSYDLTKNQLSWNERMYALYDIPVDTTPSYDIWAKAVHPDDLPRIEPLLKDTLEGKAIYDAEFRIILSDGSIRHIHTAASLERDNQGNPHSMIGLNWDISETKQKEKALRESDEQVRLLLNSTGEGIYGINLSGECTFANPACIKMLGYSSMDELLGKNMHKLIHHSYPDGTPMPVDICKIFRAFRKGEGMHIDDEVFWRKDGSCFPVDCWSYPQQTNNTVTGAVVTFTDSTERKQAEKQLADEQRRLFAILEGTNVGTWEWNVQTGEMIVNERWAGIVGYRLDELAPLSIDIWTKIVHPDDLEESKTRLTKHFNGELDYYELETRMLHKNGNWVWVLARGKVNTWTPDGKPLLMSGTHQDITTRKEDEEKIQHLATHDELTDLPSLKLLRDRLSMALHNADRYQKMVAVMFIDLDGFKLVNDTYGHDVGDKVLKEVAKHFRDSVRKTDTVARVGGDEFMIVLTDIQTLESVKEITIKVLRLIEKSIIINGLKITISASIGISLYPSDSADMDELIKLADAAMYKVKAAGKNSYGFATPAN